MTYVDDRATWYEDVDEFAEIAFGVVPGMPVGVSEGTVGTLPMFRMVERYDVGRRQVLFGYEEVLVAEGVLTSAFNVMVDANEEYVLRNVLDGIRHVARPLTRSPATTRSATAWGAACRGRPAPGARGRAPRGCSGRCSRHPPSGHRSPRLRWRDPARGTHALTAAYGLGRFGVHVRPSRCAVEAGDEPVRRCFAYSMRWSRFTTRRPRTPECSSAGSPSARARPSTARRHRGGSNPAALHSVRPRSAQLPTPHHWNSERAVNRRRENTQLACSVSQISAAAHRSASGRRRSGLGSRAAIRASSRRAMVRYSTSRSSSQQRSMAASTSRTNTSSTWRHARPVERLVGQRLVVERPERVGAADEREEVVEEVVLAAGEVVDGGDEERAVVTGGRVVEGSTARRWRGRPQPAGWGGWSRRGWPCREPAAGV